MTHSYDGSSEVYTQLEQYQSLYWDMYKEAYGVRPRGVDTSSWTLKDFEAEFDSLQQTINLNEQERDEMEEMAADRFERRVLELRSMGAKDRAMALRWIHEAEGSDGDDEYLCYLLGLRYGYFKEAV